MFLYFDEPNAEKKGFDNMKRTEIAAVYADGEALSGQEITVCGWVRTIRDMKTFGFIELNDGSCFKNLQVVFEDGTVDNYREIEDRIMAVILEAFGLHDLTPEENASWKQIDDDMLRGELREMIVSTRELPPILLASVPDFAEHPHWETEEAFLKEANDLLKLLRK